MIRKKNGFMTFVFSFLPGAGEMYMGFYKQGVSIMTIFFLLIFISSLINMGPLMYILPVIWFYSFFHANNLHSIPDDEFYALEDKYLFNIDDATMKTFVTNRKSRIIVAVALILIGVSALWKILIGLIGDVLIHYGISEAILDTISYNVPQGIFAVAIIVLGVYLIKGKKKELKNQDDALRIETFEGIGKEEKE